MYVVGEEEIEAIARVIRSGKLFRYGEEGQCATFEKRYAAYLGVSISPFRPAARFALTAAMTAMGIGPGDEVIIPAHTYMATATSVLAVGAIPVIVDVDETITISPRAMRGRDRAAHEGDHPGPYVGRDLRHGRDHGASRASTISSCIEDACQGVGGCYKGRKFGSIGHAGAFSFNYYKNMTSGEGGGVATSDPKIAERARCAIDPCEFYWQGRSDSIKPFAGNGARASELMGAMLNAQLDRLDGMIETMRPRSGASSRARATSTISASSRRR